MKNGFCIDKLHKKIAALMISACMGISVISVPLNSNAEELHSDFVEETDTGIMGVQSVEVSRFAVLSEQLSKLAEHDDGTDDISVNSRDWKQYSASYVYDKMDAKEKELYDNLDLVCKNFIEDSSVDALHLEDKSGNGADYLPAVSIDKDLIDLTNPDSSRFVDVVQLFIYANPQYYFTTSSYATSGNKLYLFCYPAFAKGEERAEVTNELFTKLDSWVEVINEENTTGVDIEKYTHDFLCNTLSYDHYSADKMSEGDYSGDIYYSQSIYSAIKKNKTVCAGYSLTFELLMNASGIPTVTAYSDYHAWNKVNLDDKWYAVDVTWDDQDTATKLDYSFYNKSDESIRFNDEDLPVHVAKASKHYPVAEKDYIQEKQSGSTLNNNNNRNNDSDDITDVNDSDNEEVIDDGDDTSNINDNDAEDVLDDDTELIDEINNQNDTSGNSDTDVYDNGSVNPSNNEGNGDDSTARVTTDNKTAADEKASKEKVAESSQKKQTTTTSSGKTVNNYNLNGRDKDETVNGTKIKKIKSYAKKIKVSWNKADNISGYEIQISTSKKFKKNVRTVKVSENSSGVWIKKLKKKTKYYVRIRTYMYLNTDKLVSEWSGVKKVTTKK